MAHHNSSVIGINTSETVIKAGASVMVGSRIAASGFDDDMCFEVAPEKNNLRTLPGVAVSDIYPAMAGEVIISGIANALLPEYFETGDQLVPDGKGGWEIDDAGSIQVVCPSADGAMGTIMLASRRPAAPAPYRGFFHAEDISGGKEPFKILISGGSTDLGQVNAKEFVIEEFTRIYLLAEYIRTGDDKGHYQLKLTCDWENEKSSDEYALWLIADAEIKTKKYDFKYLDIIQHWQNGEIFFGSRFWI